LRIKYLYTFLKHTSLKIFVAVKVIAKRIKENNSSKSRTELLLNIPNPLYK